MKLQDKDSRQGINRREFLKVFGSSALITTAALAGCKPKSDDDSPDDYKRQIEPPKGKMTYRNNPTTGDKVSILGYGMMRLPTKPIANANDENDDEIDQETVNRLVDYAIEHGVNYFDTSPAYCKGRSETSTGIALKRHQRNKYFIATKLSNFAPATWSREESMKIYRK